MFWLIVAAVVAVLVIGEIKKISSNLNQGDIIANVMGNPETQGTQETVIEKGLSQIATKRNVELAYATTTSSPPYGMTVITAGFYCNNNEDEVPVILNDIEKLCKTSDIKEPHEILVEFADKQGIKSLILFEVNFEKNGEIYVKIDDLSYKKND